MSSELTAPLKHFICVEHQDDEPPPPCVAFKVRALWDTIHRSESSLLPGLCFSHNASVCVCVCVAAGVSK